MVLPHELNVRFISRPPGFRSKGTFIDRRPSSATSVQVGNRPVAISSSSDNPHRFPRTERRSHRPRIPAASSLGQTVDRGFRHRCQGSCRSAYRPSGDGDESCRQNGPLLRSSVLGGSLPIPRACPSFDTRLSEKAAVCGPVPPRKSDLPWDGRPVAGWPPRSCAAARSPEGPSDGRPLQILEDLRRFVVVASHLQMVTYTI